MAGKVETRAQKNAKGQTKYRVRWTFQGRPQSFEATSKQDVIAVKAHVELRRNQIADTDPTIRDMSIVHGYRSTAGVPTLGDAVRDYIANRPKASSRTLNRYRVHYREYLSQWEDRPINTITEDEIVAWVRDVLRPPEPGMPMLPGCRCLAEATIHNVFGLLSGTFARTAGRVSGVVNVPKEVRPKLRISATPLYEDKFITWEQYELIEKALTVTDDKGRETRMSKETRLFARVAALAGLRWGEIAALTTADLFLNEAKPQIVVSKRVVTDEHGKVTVVKGTKANPGRNVAIDVGLARLLERHLRGRAATDRVFTSYYGKTLRYADWYVTRWAPKLDAMRAIGGPDFTFHSLRHSHGSWMLHQGLNIKEVARRLGHSPSGVTTLKVYAHVQIDADDRARQAVGNFSGPLPKKSRAKRHLQAVEDVA